jgi:8-oxo-dGTP pyrophosphatase MutT (NUDIX family)
MPPRQAYRKSYGIAMCRYNTKKNNQIEILMVKKRYTYSYFAFVFGKYKKYNNKYLVYLFNNMTFDEKITILTMQFSNMWQRLWQYDPEANHNIKHDSYNDFHSTDSYFKKKSKFETIFLVDRGKRLQRLVYNSFNAVTPWEIPKGKLNNGEAKLNGALREFEEETNVYSDKHSILWNAKPIYTSHKDENILYQYTYYISRYNKNNTWEPMLNFGSASQISEIEQVKWVSLEEINFLDLNPVNKRHLIRTYKRIIKSFKYYVKSYYYS